MARKIVISLLLIMHGKKLSMAVCRDGLMCLGA